MIKLIGICDTCHKKRFFVRNRKIMVPTAGIAKSKKMMCNNCIKIVIKALAIKNG